MKKINSVLAILALVLLWGNLSAQTSTNDPDSLRYKSVFKDGLKFNLNESGSNYVKIGFVSQLWVRENWNNPGSTVNGSSEVKNTFDVGLRRDRIPISAQVSDHVFAFAQLALDGINYLTARNQAVTLIDMTLEYKFNRAITLGGGLSGWDGLSRFSNPSVPTNLGFDQPLYQQATNGTTDQSVRMPGIYAKGKIDKLDYRLALDVPFSTNGYNPNNGSVAYSTPITASSTVINTSTTQTNPQFGASQFAANPVNPQVQGYFMYQFLDEESNLTPGTIGTYLGKKSVFNIGAGFRYQQNAMWHGDYTMKTSHDTTTYKISDTARTNMLCWSVDIYYDAPINKEKGTAITFYAAYSHYGFGQNYIRNNNPLNVTNGTIANTTGNYNADLASYNGTGNQFPMIGTGNIIFGQAGYLLPKFKNNTQFEPYVQFMYAKYDALADPSVLWDLGINYYIKGHNSRLSLDYQNRPVFNISSVDYQLHSAARLGCIGLQYQIAF